MKKAMKAKCNFLRSSTQSLCLDSGYFDERLQASCLLSTSLLLHPIRFVCHAGALSEVLLRTPSIAVFNQGEATVAIQDILRFESFPNVLVCSGPAFLASDSTKQEQQ